VRNSDSYIRLIFSFIESYRRSIYAVGKKTPAVKNFAGQNSSLLIIENLFRIYFEYINLLWIYTPKKNLPKFFCSRGCSYRRIFWKILLLHKNIFCTSSNSFAPNKYLRFGKNIYASRRISSSVGDISSACEDFIKISEFYRRYIFW
jgi:hypothetical protein